jgi:predicted house-cleaning NTP pyrophosphatase (Maf/HAM1 superfamily)
VDQVVGSYTNVVGLPVPEVLAAIREIAELGNSSKTGS